MVNYPSNCQNITLDLEHLTEMSRTTMLSKKSVSQQPLRTKKTLFVGPASTVDMVCEDFETNIGVI
jgi:hypothetical protein